jgi:hypothetical protein
VRAVESYGGRLGIERISLSRLLGHDSDGPLEMARSCAATVGC